MDEKALVVSKVSLYTSSAMAVISSLTLTEVAMLVGILGTGVGMLCTGYLTLRRDAREQRESEARLANLTQDKQENENE